MPHRRVYPECNYIMQSMLSRCQEEVQVLRRKICPASTQLCFISYMAVSSSFALNGEGNAMGFEIFPNNHIPVSCGTCHVVGKLGTCICSDAYLDTVQTLVQIAQTIWHRQHTHSVAYWTSSSTRPLMMHQWHVSTSSKTVYNTTVYCISLLDSRAVVQVPPLVLDRAIIWPIDVLSHSSVSCHMSCNRISERPITSSWGSEDFFFHSCSYKSLSFPSLLQPLHWFQWDKGGMRVAQHHWTSELLYARNRTDSDFCVCLFSCDIVDYISFHVSFVVCCHLPP